MKENKKYDYMVTATELIPPLANGRKWAGKVAYIYETSSGKDIEVNQIFPETWGETDEEAKQKQTNQVKSWIDKNS